MNTFDYQLLQILLVIYSSYLLIIKFITNNSLYKCFNIKVLFPEHLIQFLSKIILISASMDQEINKTFFKLQSKESDFTKQGKSLYTSILMISLDI